MTPITTVFGLGHLRPAPGTWASAAAIALGLVIDRFLGAPTLAAATIAVTALGFYACARSLQPGDDPSEVVIDEVAGQWLALLFPSLAFWFNGHDGWLPWPAYVSAFLFFRLFDIWKPWLVGRADRRHDPAGVMLDDLWAGLFAGICVILTGIAYHVIFIF
ncbi:MAG: phosphatidylglycerophosphatase A family protein [Paracoccaceae bacterium]